jgi:pyruvate-formate lyase-activating enzyme
MTLHACDPLDLAQKLYQRSIWADVAKVSRGESLARPLVVELDTTSFCDLACPECVSGPLLNRGQFTRDRVVRLARELVEAGVRAVILIGGGEPLLHPGTADLLTILGEARIAVGVTTNGTLISRYIDALAQNATWTRVSVDAATPGCYATFRPGRSGQNLFAQVIENMRRLAERKKGKLGYSYLLIARREDAGITHNFNEVFRAALLAKEIGCDYFEVKPSYDLNHYLISQPKRLRELLRAQLSPLDSLVTNGFDVIKSGNLNVVLENEPMQEDKTYHECPVSELRTLITPTGLYVCPYHRGEDALRFADLQTMSFAEAWNGPLRKSVMARLNPVEHCKFHCIRHRSNQELIRIRGLIDTANVVEDYDLFI